MSKTTRVLTAAALFSSLLMGPGTAPARADGAAEIADIRCMIVSMDLPKEKDEAAPTAAMISVMFFLGRIEGRDPAYDVKQAISVQMALMRAEERITERKRCMTEVLEKGRAAAQLGVDLINQGRIDLRQM